MLKCKQSKHVLTVVDFFKVFQDIKVENTDQVLREVKLGQKAVLLECASYGSLHDLSFYTKSLEEDTAFILFHQIMCGLRDIHRANIAHLDIKETNILICRSEES
jgi:serine/threonine protein kinase